MNEQKSQTARVERPREERHFDRFVAAFFVLSGLWVLFLCVGPKEQALPYQTPETHTFADFRDLMAPPVRTVRRDGNVTRRSNTKSVLEVLGASPDAATAAASAITQTKLVNARRLPEGTQLTAHFAGTPDRLGDLLSVSLRANAQKAVLVTRRSDGSFLSSVLSARKANGLRRIAGTIETSLQDAIVSEGGLKRHADTMIGLFPDDAALKAGGRPGERFDVVYEVVEDERGNLLSYGELVFAAFDGETSKGSWYRYTPSDTRRTEFYNADGETHLPLLSRYPVGFVPITSGFGPRYHPLSGERRQHLGVDFYARYGTKIYAAGDGVIERADWGNGYGRQVRITHKRGITTLYAHLSAFAEGIRPGVEVHKGDLIGYVGASGTATGPHLHYEIRKDGIQINPALIKLPSGRRLSKHPVELVAFRTRKKDIDAFRGAFSSTTAGTLTLGVRRAF